MSYSETIANEIRASVARVGEECLGQRRAFVSEVYADMQARGVTHTDLGSFKALLMGLKRHGLIELGRCDLVEAFDHAAVQASQIGGQQYGEPSWHFVKVEGDRGDGIPEGWRVERAQKYGGAR